MGKMEVLERKVGNLVEWGQGVADFSISPQKNNNKRAKVKALMPYISNSLIASQIRQEKNNNPKINNIRTSFIHIPISKQ